MKKVLRAISLFSNCGAGDIGFAKAGFKFDVLAELDPYRLAVAQLNHPQARGVLGDLRTTWRTVVAESHNRLKNNPLTLLAACPPCQGMSSARSDRGNEKDADAGTKDKRNLLVTVIRDVAKELRPKFIVVENVVAFFTRKVRHPETQRGISAAKLLAEALCHRYQVFPLLIDLCDYGIPQYRKRAFLIFVRLDQKCNAWLAERNLTPYPMPTHTKGRKRGPITLREALQRYRLPSLDASSEARASSQHWGGLHTVPVWLDHRYPMVAAIPPGSGQSAWGNSKCETCGSVDVDDDDAECPECQGPLLRPVVKKKRGGYRLVRGFRSSTYARMRPDQPAATITTASGHIGSNHTLHPFENRVLSPLECARLQTIPADFKWGRALEEWGHTNVREMIGEAVPPLFTKRLGKVLAALERGETNDSLLPADDARSKNARKRLGLDTH